MKMHTVQVVDLDQILDALFKDDVASMNEVVEYLLSSGWTFGDACYTLVNIDAFLEFLYDCVQDIPALTTEQIEHLRDMIPVQVYVNLEAQR